MLEPRLTTGDSSRDKVDEMASGNHLEVYKQIKFIIETSQKTDILFKLPWGRFRQFEKRLNKPF